MEYPFRAGVKYTQAIAKNNITAPKCQRFDFFNMRSFKFMD